MEAFTSTMRLLFGAGLNESDFCIPFTWDSGHLLNCAVTDVRDGSKSKAIEASEFFQFYVARANTFAKLLSHGKGFALLKAICQKHNATFKIPQVYAAQR